jgi:hypothetical protein
VNIKKSYMLAMLIITQARVQTQQEEMAKAAEEDTIIEV